MKTNRIILSIIILFSYFSCNLYEKKVNQEQMSKNVSITLTFHPRAYTSDSRYTISISNDSLNIERKHSSNINSYVKALTPTEFERIKYLFSQIKTKYKNTTEVEDAWGVTLTINEIVYYEDYDFSFNTVPKEYQELINYIIGLSPIKIDLYGFA